MLKQLPILLLLSLFTSTSFAQHFMYESNEFKVQQNGYHKIELNEQIINKLNASLSNIRLHDKDNREVKFFFQAPTPINSSLKREALLVRSHEVKENCCTYIVIENPSRLTIDEFWLHTSPFSGYKTIKLSGSDDHEQWIPINEAYQVNYSPNHTISITAAYRTEYHYYRIEIDDFETLPIKIPKIEAQTSLFPKDNYSPLPQPVVIANSETNNHRDTTLYIDFSFTERQYINWLDFYFTTNTPNYNFNVELQAKQNPNDFFQHIESFQLGNGKPNHLIMNKLYGQYFRLKIINQHKHKITFHQIQAHQLKYTLLANLYKDNIYKLRFGGEHPNTLLTIPERQIHISDTLEIIYPNTIQTIYAEKKQESLMNGETQNTWLFWSMISGGLIVLAAATWFGIKKWKMSQV